MSLLAFTQISPPSDEQAFERTSIVLWRELLGDPNVQRVGRRGQRQNGVDLIGKRGEDPTRQVGVQCKLKGLGKELSENEVRNELKKALKFKPLLREYYIATTAPDDATLQELARTLELEINQGGRSFTFQIWGWNTLEERITEYPKARKAFDPTYGPFADTLSQDIACLTQVGVQTRDQVRSLEENVAALSVQL